MNRKGQCSPSTVLEKEIKLRPRFEEGSTVSWACSMEVLQSPLEAWGLSLHFPLGSPLCLCSTSVCLSSPRWKQRYISSHFLYEKRNKVET